jgi:hypothetical protein
VLCNVGKSDRLVRIIVGAAITLQAIVVQSVWLGILGILLIASGVTGWCGVYQLLGKSTNRNP